MSRKPILPPDGEVPAESLTWLQRATFWLASPRESFGMVDERFTAIEERLDALEPKTEPTPQDSTKEMIAWADRYVVEHPNASYGDIADAWRARTGDTP